MNGVRDPRKVRSGLGPALAVLGALAATGLPAQEANEVFEETVDVRVANVEVVVLDDEGRPVDGLQREDFRLLVDGQVQELTNFYAVARTVDAGRPEDPKVEEPPLPADSTQGLTVVVFVDNLGIRPENRRALFESLERRLRRLESDVDLARSVRGEFREPVFMVVSHDRRFEIVEPLTSDLDRVLGALRRVESESSLFAALDGSRRMFMSRLDHAYLRRYQPRPGSEQDPEFNDAIRVALDLAVSVRSLAEERYQAAKQSFEALAGLSEALAGLPGRKALLYLSDGLPLRPADSLIDAWTGKYQNWVLQNADDMRFHSRYPDAPARFQRLMSSIGSSEFDLQNQLNRMVTTAAGAKVVFYPVSAGGRSGGFVSAEISGAGMHGDVGAGSMRRTAMATENFTRDASLLRMAEDTGGRALLRSTAIDDFFGGMARDFTSYYSLGFTPPTGEDGRLHDLEITVLHPNLRVLHAKGYVAKNWRQRLGEQTAAAAVHGREHNPLGVEVDPGVETEDGKRFVLPLMIKVPFDRIRLVHQDAHFNAQLTVLVLVGEPNGVLSRSHRIDIPIKIPDSRVLEVLEQKAAYPIDLRIEEGRKRIAVGVRDHLAETESAVIVEVSVGRGVQHGG